MVHLINKDALVAEIEKFVDKCEYHEGYDCGFHDGINYTLDELKEKINTLEVKEVDLDEEIEKCLKRHSMLAVGKRDFADIAKHFFELGLKAQKEE